MENRRYLICSILLLAIAAGCQALHSYRPVAIEARDAETKQPIAGADVRISYPLTRPSQSPYDSTATTGADGIARLRAAPYGEDGILVEAAATGYLSEDQSLTVAELQAIEPAHLFEDVNKRPVRLVLDLYAGPRPTIELVVPSGYRGTVKAEVQVRANASCPAGQRSFSYDVPPSGIVQAAGPPLLERVGCADFRIRYADGTSLSGQAVGAEIGFWCLKYEGDSFHFLIGTRGEYDALRPSSNTEDAKPGRSAGGKGKGQGRRNRNGGNQPPADPGP